MYPCGAAAAHLISYLYRGAARTHMVSGLEMTIDAKTTRTIVHCPECQQPTQKVHSSYRRRLRDLPTAGLRVRLFRHDHLWLSPFDHLVDRSIDLIRDRYFRSTFQFPRLFMA